MDILFLDLETTGVDYKRHKIIEFGALYYRNGKKVSSFECKFGGNNMGPISLQALKINRTTLYEINSRRTEQEQISVICDWFLDLKSDKPIRICGQNVHFDYYFLKELLSTAQIEDINSIFSFKLIDTSDRANMLIDAGLITIPEGKRKNLETIAESLNIYVDHNKTHTALYDAELSAQVYYAMENLLRGLNGRT